jgi:molybdate transport system substrate-binding protein
MYMAAVTMHGSATQQAQRLIDLLTATNAQELRNRAGFVGKPD